MMRLLPRRVSNDFNIKNNKEIYNEPICKEWLSGRGAQNDMFERADKCKDTFYTARQTILPYDKTKTTYEYNSFKNLNSFINYQSNIDESKHFYEIIREGTKCKEYYDIDAIKTDFNSITDFLIEFDNLREEFIKSQDIITGEYDKPKLLETYQKDFYGYPKIHERQLIPCQIVTESCNDKKMSLHIIYNHKCLFKNSREMKFFMESFDSFLKTKKTKIQLDLSVYNKNSLMRCIGSSKALDRKRVFNPIYLNYPIQNFFISTSSCFVTYNLNITEQPKRDTSIYPVLSNEEELEFCKKLISKINKERASNYDNWFKMGCGLYNTLNGSKEGLELFLEFSQLDPYKYDEQACIDLYQSFRDPELNDNISKGSLIYWFNQDNPRVTTRYRKFKL